MGCGVSTLDLDHKPHPGRIRPVLCGRFYDVRGNRNSNAQECPPIQKKITEAFGSVEGRKSEMGETQCRVEVGNEDGNITQEEKTAIDDGRRILSHGSPSFRVYCKESAERILNLVKQEGLDGYIDADDIVEGEKISRTEESVCSNEVSSAKETPPKKGIRMSMFKKMKRRNTSNSFSFCNVAHSSENSPLLQKAVQA